jgi:hypothetical protein
MENNDLTLDLPENENKKFPSTLFVGARVYRINYGDITDVITIERVTKSQAIAKGGGYRFKIDVNSYGYVTEIGESNRWSSSTHYLETPELREKLLRQNAIRKIKKVNFSKLSLDALNQILSLVGEDS